MDGVEGINYEGFKRLEGEFEPSVVAEKYMIVKDDQIHETNLPEWLYIYIQFQGYVKMIL